MKAEEWLTLFCKDLWTSPKDDRGLTRRYKMSVS